MRTLTAEVTAVADLTHDVRLLTLALLEPPRLDFLAGQFVTLRAPRADDRPPVNRAYSIASPPSRATTIDLLFNLVPGGPGSSYLHAQRPGDRLDLRGPAGAFVLRPEIVEDRDLLFVATGTGIAPFLSMIPAALPNAHRVTLFWGLRHERDLYLQQEWQALADAHPEFSFVTTLSRPSPVWRGAVGRVQRLIEAHITSVDRLAVFLCGSSGMITSVTDLLRARGDCPIEWEQYYLDVEAGAT